MASKDVTAVVKRRTIIQLVAALGPVSTAPVFVQEYPSRPLRLLVPNTAIQVSS